LLLGEGDKDKILATVVLGVMIPIKASPVAAASRPTRNVDEDAPAVNGRLANTFPAPEPEAMISTEIATVTVFPILVYRPVAVAVVIVPVVAVTVGV
jgi:hypothetical protein